MAPATPRDDSSPRVSDTALRKKKNADAQAAFRARRANYIATLEETGVCPNPFPFTFPLSEFFPLNKSHKLGGRSFTASRFLS
jgi:hypothetical protein